MNVGKCKEPGCEQPTKPMRNGGFFDYCWTHKQEHDAARASLPTPKPVLPQSAQEEMQNIGIVYRMALHQAFASFDELTQTMANKVEQLGVPSVPTEYQAIWTRDVAMHLSNQFWKNHRTPKA